MNIRPIIIGLFAVLIGLVIYKGLDKSLSKEGYKYSSLNQKGELKVLILDAGHGGFDHGCSGKLSKEKFISLSVIKKVRDKIEAAYPDMKVILTRDKDVFIPLDERAKIANRNKADLFMSVHCNFFKRDDVFGTETFVRRNPTSPSYSAVSETHATIQRESKYENEIRKYNKEKLQEVTNNLELNIKHSTLLASLVEKNFKKKASRFSRGVKHANFYVLRNTWMPSVLIEVGFLSHPEEEKFLSSEFGQEAIVSSIFESFKAYKKQVESDKAIEVEEKKPEEIIDSLPTAAEKKNKLPSLSSDVVEREEKVDNAIKEDITSNALSDEGQIETVSEPVDKNSDRLLFRIQLVVKSKKEDVKSSPWNAIPGLEIMPAGSVYKYVTKGVDSYAESLTLKEDMKALGYKDAFVVAYKGKERIDLATALKYAK